MKLNNARIENIIDKLGNTVRSVKTFINMLKSENFTADVYFNNHLIRSVPVKIYEDSGYLFASLQFTFAVNQACALSNILIKVHYTDTNDIIFSSHTINIDLPIVSFGDYRANIRFMIMSAWSENETTVSQAESDIIWLKTNNNKPIDLQQCNTPYKNIISSVELESDNILFNE